MFSSIYNIELKIMEAYLKINKRFHLESRIIGNNKLIDFMKNLLYIHIF